MASTVLSRWSGRLAARRKLLERAEAGYAYWRKRLSVARPGTAAHKRALAMTRDRKALVARRRAQVDEAERVVARHSTTRRPRVLKLGRSVENRFGALGTLVGAVGHYTAGPRDTSDAHALALWRQYHEQHRRQGWGGIGYHYGITINGSLVLLRPPRLKGAHTAGANTGRVGVVVHGGPGQRATAAQQATLAWLLRNAHTEAMPASHRVPRKLDQLRVWGHNDLTATACPGAFKPFYLSHGKDR